MAAQPVTREAFVELLSDYVRDALQQRLRDKHSSHYALLLTSFDRLHTQPAHEIKATIKALTQHVSLIDHVAHEQLLLKVFGTSLWEFASDVVEAVASFAVSLVSANIACLHGCVDVLVGNFTAPAEVAERLAGDAPARDMQTQTVLHHVHGALGKIMDLVPSAATVVLHTVLQRLPHKRFVKEVHQQFLHSVFRVAETPAGASIRDGLLLGVIDRLLEVDVEIKYEELDDLDDADSDSDVDADALFQLEEAPGGEELSQSEARAVDETADKLDAMMVIVFAYLGRRLRAGETETTTQVLLRAFQTSLLQTYKSKFTQYLLFYVCAHDATLHSSVAFCQTMSERIADTSHPAILRIAAASYMASFLARSSFLSPAFVLQYLASLSRWCSAYIDRHEQVLEDAAVSVQAVPEAQPVFEAVCQGLLYVLCYRMETFAESSHALAHLRSLPLDRLFNHQLQPLRACAPTIAYEYVRRAKPLRMPGRTAARVFAAAHLVDGRDPEAATAAARQRRPLDTFFPFDPYLLRRSAAQLELKRTYIKWHSSDADGPEALDDDESDGQSTFSGLDEHPGSAADDSFREGHLFVPVQAGFARPAPLGGTAMSYEDAAVLSGSSFGGLSLQ